MDTGAARRVRARRMGYRCSPPGDVRREEGEVRLSFESSLDKAVRRDVMEVVTEPYVEHHLRPLQKWRTLLGLKLRIQPYGLRPTPSTSRRCSTSRRASPSGSRT
ncbi:hypothetical protein [Streptomyces sp. KL116D]|uniref:hypothetical protein n=1 Tax=Streptomyces sp. KL116D TaxID=3045152 RepID=UPI0035589D17